MARYGDLDTQYFDDAGDPLINGKIFFFETGTTTPKPTFADVNFTIPNAHPVILTAAGRQPNIFFQGVAKAVLATSAGVQILVRDPVGETASTFGNPWIASKDYNANDVVQGSDGDFYRSLVNGNVNNNPVTTTGSWTFLYSVEWSAGTTYKTGSVVTYESIVYQSLQNANLNQNPSTATTFWVPIQLVWSATSVYALNANVVGTDGILYTSLQAANTGNNPASSPTFWVGTSAAAAASAVAAAASAAAALVSENAADADAIATAADRVQTGLDAAATAADAVQTGLDASASAASASAALASENAAAASYDLFDDRYLGAKASDPTLDNDGNALVTGAMYFNTVSNTTRIYNGSGWQDTAAIATSISLTSQVTGVLPIANGGTGITSFGTGVATALGNNTNATGGLVTVDGTATLTAKTLTDPAIIGTILEDVYTIVDGAAFEIDPSNGSIQLITLGASRTPKATNFAAGEAITLMVNDGTDYTLTWTDATWGGSGVIWSTDGGVAPTLNTTGFTSIVLWKVSTQVYGARVGDA
jgi:hypothetical protein